MVFCHFSDGNQWYAWATLTFVFIPVVLSVTFGKGYKELHEAATLKKWLKKNKERVEIFLAHCCFPAVEKVENSPKIDRAEASHMN